MMMMMIHAAAAKCAAACMRCCEWQLQATHGEGVALAFWRVSVHQARELASMLRASVLLQPQDNRTHRNTTSVAWDLAQAC
jgi:hypothetical protein